METTRETETQKRGLTPQKAILGTIALASGGLTFGLLGLGVVATALVLGDR